MPDAASPRPTKEEWETAKPINTARREERSAGCKLGLVREWVGVFCGVHLFVGHEADLGKPGADYFKNWGGTEPGFAFRLRKGHTAAGWVVPLEGEKRAYFWSTWPTTTDGPVVLALKDARYVPEWELMESIPAIAPSSAKASRPVEADWMLAKDVSTARELGDERCRMLLLRDWVKVRCVRHEEDSSLSGFRDLQNLGKKDDDYFVVRKFFHNEFEVELRLEAGMDREAEVFFGPTGENGRLKFKVRWPEDEDRPDVLAIEKVE